MRPLGLTRLRKSHRIDPTEPPFRILGSRDRVTNMKNDRHFGESVLFSLLRLSPIAVPATLIPVIPSDPLLADLAIKLLIIFLTLLISWNMTEGAMILWMKAKSEASASAKGLTIVTILCAAVMLAMLQYFRNYTSRGAFIVLLVALSLRGMSRSGWENGRPHVGFLGAFAGNSLLTLTSIMLATNSFDWQSAVCAVAIGSSLAAVEAAWYADAFAAAPRFRWTLPLFRTSLVVGPIIIGTMGMANQLPQPYSLVLLVVFAGSRLVRKSENDTIPRQTLRGAAGVYLLFLAAMAACKAYQAGTLA